MMGFDRITFGGTELYFPKKTDKKTKFVLNTFSYTTPANYLASIATNPQDYDKPHTLLVLTSSDVNVVQKDSTIEHDFNKVVDESWGNK